MGWVRFAVLGLGAGAVYALAAQGIVLVYRGSGVLNFAHGAIGMVGAFVFYNQREGGTPTWLAWVMALGLGAAIGVAFHLGVMRPMRRAPALARLIATLGLLTVLLGFGEARWGETPKLVQKLLPTADTVTFWDDVVLGKDRLVILLIGAALTTVLMAVYRFTRFGLATTAVAENRQATAAQGISPDVVASVNWAAGGMLAVLAGILIVNITSLKVFDLTLLVVPALAAALVGGFRSFPLTFLGGLLIGVLESEVAYLQVRLGPSVTLSGLARSVPFVVIIVVLVVRGRALPLRGEASEHPPEVGTGRIRPRLVVPAALVVLGSTWLISTQLVDAFTTTCAIAIVLLSLVVVTGYTGQLSLAQFALAGMGAWIAAKLVADHAMPFELAMLLGVLGAIPVGVIVGLPALRTRGVNLAVVTLGLALVIESMILNNAQLTGGVTGTVVGAPRFFGVDFDTFEHPERYAALSFVLLVLVAVAVANLRRGRAGRRLIAVRTNERAAASLGISVFGAKLYAFGLAAGIAAVGGILLGFHRPNVTFWPTFSIFQSIFMVVYAVIGGIGFVLGPVIGAALAPHAFVPTWASSVFGTDETVQITLGLALLVLLVVRPDGLASVVAQLAHRVRGGARRPAPSDEDEHEDPGRVHPSTLTVRNLRVRFGGVVALDDVSLDVRPGQVVGLIGPNGAGKTTLIDAVTGFTPIVGGVVGLDGTSLEGWSPRRRALAGIGRSFQSLELFDTMTVRDNLVTACETRNSLAYLTDLVRPGRRRLRARATAAVREFGLEADLERRVDELPYGRRRLVAIARAIAADPSVLLLDEPAAGLDESETAELGALVRRVADEWGLAVLLVEHDVSLVLSTCDRVTVLHFGQRIAEGTPAQVRDDPVVVAAYLGIPKDAAREPVHATATRPPPRTVPDEALIAARDLSAGYGALAAVRGVDLEVRSGEVVALLGPNGAGKTTTLLALAGELTPLGGEVVWRGSSRTAPLHARARQGLAFVPGERGVFAGLTTIGNLRLGRGTVEDACGYFPELELLLHRRAGLLSGGEQQMLTLARALAAKPGLLLADELSLGLAPLAVRRILGAVRDAADTGVGVLLVEQHARDALEISDRAYVLHNGRIEFAGDAEELRSDPAALRAAYLTGST
ncbi:MAG: ATP-binding cassette domain-containing protein [Acidimicrobiia bacterium]